MIKDALLKLHRFLLPPEDEIGYLPYIWLVYLGMLFIGLFFGDASASEWLKTLATVAVFLPLYFRGFWVCDHHIIKYIVAIALLGMVTATFNPGASVYIVFAGAFAANIGTVRKALATLVMLNLAVMLYSWYFSISGFFYYPALVFSTMIGLMNIYQAELRKKNQQLKHTEQELQHMARAAERERIARDLHDVMGHTFSMITIKAQLARKLIDADASQAKQELQELEDASRKALAEVRSAVSGYRQRSLQEELVMAKNLLHAAELSPQVQPETIPGLPKEIDQALAYLVREAVTNVVKHSDATECQVSLSQNQNQLELTIADDGKVDNYHEGNGIKGMRERLQNINGKLRVSVENGFNIRATVDLG